MKRLLTLLVLMLTVALGSATPAQAGGNCFQAASLIRVTWFWQNYRLAYFSPTHSQEFAALAALPDAFTGQMAAVYGKDINYWLLDNGKVYFATAQAYPYLLEYYVGKYDGQSECQVLVGLSAEYPSTAFAYVFSDYWQQLNDGDSAVHPEYGAYYLPLEQLVSLLGTPTSN